MWHLVVMEGKDGLLMNQFVKYYQNDLISLVDLDRKESICHLKVLMGARCKLAVFSETGIYQFTCTLTDPLCTISTVRLCATGTPILACSEQCPVFMACTLWTRLCVCTVGSACTKQPLFWQLHLKNTGD